MSGKIMIKSLREKSSENIKLVKFLVTVLDRSLYQSKSAFTAPRL